MDSGASATTARPSCNVGFFTTPGGWFKVAEFIMGLLVWPLLASVAYWLEPALQFVMFVTVTTWILTSILMIMYVLAIHSTILSGAPWDIIEFFFNASCALLYFIAACIEAAFAAKSNVLIASTIFAFLLSLVYLAHTFYAWKIWRGFHSDGTDVNK